MLKFRVIRISVFKSCPLNVKKFQKYFFGLKVSVKTEKLLNLGKKILQIESNFFFRKIISAKNLVKAWVEFKNDRECASSLYTQSFSVKIDRNLVRQLNHIILNGWFKYSNSWEIKVLKNKRRNFCATLIRNFNVSLVERALFNGVKFYFEGIQKWKYVSEERVKNLLTQKILNSDDYKKSNCKWSIKIWSCSWFLEFRDYELFNKEFSASTLERIKKWTENIKYILSFKIERVLSNIQVKLLRKNFLKHTNQCYVWLELKKMMSAKILNVTLKDSLSDRLSLVIYNIYLKTLDELMLNLKSKQSLFFLSDRINSASVAWDYKSIKAYFQVSDTYKLLKLYGSSEKLSIELNRHLKNHYKVYHKYYNVVKRQPRIVYHRFFNMFLLGVTVFRAPKITKLIKNFLSKTLYFKAIEVKAEEKNVLFRGYWIGFVKFSRKTLFLSSKSHFIEKNKKWIWLLFKASDLQLQKSAFLLARSSLLSAYKAVLVRNKWSTAVSHKVSWLFLRFFVLKRSKGLSKWLNALKEKGVQKMFFVLKFYIENLQQLSASQELNNEVAIKIKRIKDWFLNELSSTYFKKFEKRYNDFKGKSCNMSSINKILMKKNLGKDNENCVIFSAPIKEISQALSEKGFLNWRSKKAWGNPGLISWKDAEILFIYAIVIHALLSYYRNVTNLNRVSNLVNNLRQSCVLTLAWKHKKSKSWVYKVYGYNLKIKVARKKFIKLPLLKRSVNFITKAGVSRFFLNHSVFRKFDSFTGIQYKYPDFLFQCSVPECLGKYLASCFLKKARVKSLSLKKVLVSKQIQYLEMKVHTKPTTINLLLLCRKHYLNCIK